MSTQTKPFKPFVPEHLQMPELTARALLLGLAMTIVLGAANAYLGLRAGMTVAATYPAAVIGMAAIRAWRGSILEENIARTSGTIGEGVASGAIFTIPAFLMVKAWPITFGFAEAYWKTTTLIMVGSVLGVLFISLVRRVMVEDPELPFPESVAAAEIHKAGQRGAQAARYLFWNIGLGGLVFLLSRVQLFASDMNFTAHLGVLGSGRIRLGTAPTSNAVNAGGITTFSAPSVSPAFLGVGYIIGPKLASLLFSGGVISWGLLIPMLMYFTGPQLRSFLPANAPDATWMELAGSVNRFIVRPIAVGGMLVGAGFTLFRMRQNLAAGLSRAVRDVRQAQNVPVTNRTERYMSFKLVFALIGIVFVAMIALYIGLSGLVVAGIVAALVMLVLGFFFATVSGSLCGVIGSSNNPVSGLTLSTLIIAALLMVALGVSGPGGVAAVLGVAAVVCVSSAVAGELLQDFKAGYILGGTPRNIQIAELVAVVVASLVMYFPLWLLHSANIKNHGIGFGDPALPAPQAGLMALLAQGIVGGDMAWPLLLVGVFFGIAMIMMGIRSPMIVSVGMYLPLGTTFAIWLGGLFRWLGDSIAHRRGYNEAQRARVENTGVLIGSGLIAGEALLGLVWAGLQFTPESFRQHLVLIQNPSYAIGAVVLLLLAFVMIRTPLANAGSPDEPAPPVAMM